MSRPPRPRKRLARVAASWLVAAVSAALLVGGCGLFSGGDDSSADGRKAPDAADDKGSKESEPPFDEIRYAPASTTGQPASPPGGAQAPAPTAGTAAASLFETPEQIAAAYRTWPRLTEKAREGAAASHPGRRHLYMNQRALDNFAAGNEKDYAVGATLVYEEINERGDQRLSLLVMQKRDRRSNPDADGWRFARFAGGDAPVEQGGAEMAACSDCHERQARGDMVASAVEEFRPRLARLTGGGK
ncbi:MAG: cytochrome P460 family protein [Planctomycetes bacterium]|nr:cytochrome P460 family protein [Planctomycetota bacterium]